MTHKLERLVVFCPHCSFSTNRKFNLNRHLNNKHKDKILNHEFFGENVQNVIPSIQDVVSTEQFVISNQEINEFIIQSDNENNTKTDICDSQEEKEKKQKDKLLYCKKCYKEYSTKRLLINHENKCQYVDNLTCPKCMTSFTNRHNKNRHIKRNTCKPKSIRYARNHMNQEQNNRCMPVHNYGSERMDYMDYEKYLQIFKKCYDIPSAITKEIHFNVEFPENHNIIYNNERTALVKMDDKFIYKDLRILVEELIKEKSRLVQEFARENKENICNTLSNELYDQIINLLLKLVLIKEPSTIYKKQVKMIIDMVRNTKLDTTELIKRSF
jgi:hypothetical protein